MEENYHDSILTQWKRDDETFVETRVSRHIFDCLTRHSFVTVTGGSGVGKTSTVRHIALKMAHIGYDINILSYFNDVCLTDTRKSFFKPQLLVLDDFFGKYNFDGLQFGHWRSRRMQIAMLHKNHRYKTIVVCRLQIYRDDLFTYLPFLGSCICSFEDPDLILSMSEKNTIAETYLQEDASMATQYAHLHESFPLLCKLASVHTKLKCEAFFKNPIAVYVEIISKLSTYEYCALALCVMFNNHVNDEWLIGETDAGVQKVIEHVLEACNLSKNTSKLILRSAFESLSLFISKDLKQTHTGCLRNEARELKLGHLKTRKNLKQYGELNCEENGFFHIIHDKIFDFLASYFGSVMMECVIKNADSKFISERFILQREDKSNIFSIVVPEQYFHLYLKRMITDWINGKIVEVFFNVNLKRKEFRDRLIKKVNSMKPSLQRELVFKLNTDEPKSLEINPFQRAYEIFTPLLLCCFFGYVEMVQWCCEQKVELNYYTYKGETRQSIASRRRSFFYGHLNKDKETFDLLNDNKTDFDIGTPLLTACEIGSIEIVKLLLDYKADVNGDRIIKSSPLLAASTKGYTKIVKLLLDHKADVNFGTPLLAACEIENIEIVKLLLDHKAAVNSDIQTDRSPLLVASTRGNTYIVKLLLEHKADVNVGIPCLDACEGGSVEKVKKSTDYIGGGDIQKDLSPLLVASACGKTDVVKLLLQHKADVNLGTPLTVACDAENVNIVKILLDYKADVNGGRQTDISPLLAASTRGNTDIVKLLLEHNVDVNLGTPLTIACEKEHVEIVKLLLDHKADVNVDEQREKSPLLVVCQNGNAELVKLLLDNRADVNFYSRLKTTPLVVACKHKNVEIVKLLLDHKADVNFRTSYNKTSLLVACENENEEVVKLLLAHNADVNASTFFSKIPLLVACENENAEIVKLLLDHRADANFNILLNIPPIFVACTKSNEKIVKLLLDKNVNIDIIDKTGRSPLYLAYERGYTEIVKLLLQKYTETTHCTTDGESLYFASFEKELQHIIHTASKDQKVAYRDDMIDKRIGAAVSYFEQDIKSAYRTSHEGDMTSFHFLLQCDGIQIDCIIGRALAKQYSKQCISGQTSAGKSKSFTQYMLIDEYSSEFEMMYTLQNWKRWNSEKQLLQSVERKWWMLSRWILANKDIKKICLEVLLFKSFSADDGKAAKAISWRIVRNFYTEFKLSLINAVDMYPGFSCKCSAFGNNDKAFCSDEKIIIVTAKGVISGLPRVYSGFKIEVNNPTYSTYKTKQNKNLENYMNTEFKESFLLQIDIPFTTAEDLFRKHSNLTLICPSAVRLSALNNNHKFKDELCIHLYCKHKCIIPIDESHFPDMLHGVPVNVIEGQAQFIKTLRVGDKIGPQSCSGTLAGFVQYMDVFDCFLTCAHVMFNVQTLLSNDFMDRRGAQAFLHTSQGQFQCGNVIRWVFHHDDPKTTSVDAALTLMQNYATVDPNDFASTMGSLQTSPNLGLSSPYLNTNCVHHNELRRSENISCVGATTGNYQCTVQFPKQAEVDINFSSTGTTAAVVNGQLYQPLWLNSPAHVRLASGRLTERRIFCMYNQIALQIPLKAGDSGTGIYIVNHPNGKNGCVGMAIAFCPATGITIVTPLSEILTRLNS